MLYYLFTYLDEKFDFVGAGVFQYITFRSGLALILSLVISMVFGKYFIKYLAKKQIGESVRDLGLDGQKEKQGTPTMGGLIIILCIIVPTLLLTKLNNVYILLLLITTIWTGALGFLDDYIKVIKKNKEGLSGKLKIVGQVGLGLIVGITLYFNNNVTVRQYQHENLQQNAPIVSHEAERGDITNTPHNDVKSTITTIPFFKNNELNYNSLLPFLPKEYTWV
ncbi:MAG: phospho-N-acetylmuramoyl-pentapeptide-transferase, partial [Cyclobacteriaceae bacterium]